MTPLERAARAIDEVLDLRIAHMTGREMLNDGTITTALARAVLTAIREPGEEWTDAAMRLGDANNTIIAWGDYTEFWQAMIDAALAEDSR